MTDLTPETVTAQLSERLAVAVAESGFVKPANAEIACRVMREELETFVAQTEYADERHAVVTGAGCQLSWQTLITTVLLRIFTETARQKGRPE